MLVTLSEPKFAQLIRELEGLETETTDEEIFCRVTHYSQRLMNHVREFGIALLGVVENTPKIGTFKFDVSGTHIGPQGCDWPRLLEAIEFLRPVCVSVEHEDIQWLCGGIVAVTMADRWGAYANTLQRIPVGELRQRLEDACQAVAWTPVADYVCDSPDLSELKEAEIQDVFQRAGVRDPLAHRNELDAFRAREEEEERQRQALQYEQWKLDNNWA